jgi:hypothetical protein
MARIAGKRKPSFRVGAAYSTPPVHAVRCAANRGGPCHVSLDGATGLPCKHRLEERARKKIDPAHVAPGGTTECCCEAWAAAMQHYHPRGALCFTNCDPTQWATAPWEVAKAYVLSLGSFNTVDNRPADKILAKLSPNDFDPATLFNLPQYCLAFQGATMVLPDGSTHTFPISIDKARWAAATTARNDTIGHSAEVGLEKALYDEAMAALDALLNDPALHTPGEPYVEKVKWAQEQLNLIKGASAQDMEDRYVTRITEARDATEHYAARRCETVKVLTDRQAAEFLDWHNKKRQQKNGTVVKPFRKLVQAPSGSGKTLIAVKMADAFIANGATRSAFEAASDSDSDSEAAADAASPEYLLLLGHSETLAQQELLRELEMLLQAHEELVGERTVSTCVSGKNEAYVTPYSFANNLSGLQVCIRAPPRLNRP